MDYWQAILAGLTVAGGLVHVFAAQQVVSKPLGSKWITVQRIAGAATLIFAVPLLLAAI